MKYRLVRMMLLALLPLWIAVPCGADALALARAPTERWILVDAESASLRVMHGDNERIRFNDIALGRGGIKQVHFSGDTSTPTGEYHINHIKRNSNYTLFLQLNYPTREHGKKALALGRISQAQFDQIEMAEWEGTVPPQDTPLGGLIGIHGIGNGSLEVHRQFNWTEGCVALDNDQIRELAGHVRVGMRVVIQ